MIEKCPKCSSEYYTVARDTTSRRRCAMCHTEWACPDGGSVDYKEMYFKLLVQSKRSQQRNMILKSALLEIAKDFGTDHCDGNTMLAKYALEHAEQI